MVAELMQLVKRVPLKSIVADIPITLKNKALHSTFNQIAFLLTQLLFFVHLNPPKTEKRLGVGFEDQFYSTRFPQPQDFYQIVNNPVTGGTDGALYVLRSATGSI